MYFREVNAFMDGIICIHWLQDKSFDFFFPTTLVLESYTDYFPALLFSSAFENSEIFFENSEIFFDTQYNIRRGFFKALSIQHYPSEWNRLRVKSTENNIKEKRRQNQIIPQQNNSDQSCWY